MRNRSSAIAITTNKKKRLSQEIDGDKGLNEREKQQRFFDIMEKNLRQENRLKPFKPFDNKNIIDLPTPQYLDIRKEYNTKDEKALIFFNLANFIP